jgi:ribosomal protein S12 methylthiotransferase
MIGRTQYDAPDIDNIVLLSDSEDLQVPRLEPGQMRECKITQNLTFDLVGYPIS